MFLFLVNYQHSKTLINTIMAATISGFLQIVEKLMRLGADLYLKSCNEMTVMEWAKRFTKNEIVDLIECYL